MKKRKIILALAVSVTAATIGWSMRPTDKPVSVKTTSLQIKSVEQTVTCTGKVESETADAVVLPVTCVIGEVAVKAGQAVHQGDILLTVDKEKSQGEEDQSLTERMTLATMGETVTADTDGIVLSVDVEAGDTVKAGEVCCTVVPRDSLQVRIAIREKYLPQLETGQVVRIQGDGFSRASYRGELASVSSSAKTTGSNGETVVEGIVTLLDGEADDSFRLGLTAKAHIVTSTVSDGIVIPYAAVFSEEDGQECVYLVKNGVACKQEIHPQAELASGVLLRAADFDGARVVLQPERVSDQTAVEESL